MYLVKNSTLRTYKPSKHAALTACFALMMLIFSLPASAGTKTWSGATNSNWGTGSNWVGGVAPSSGDDALIPGGLLNYPIINGTVTIADITINNIGIGASVTVTTGGILNASGLITVNATGSYIQDNGNANLTGITASGTVSVSGGTLLSDVNITLNLGATLNQSGGLIHLANAVGTNPTDNILIATGATLNQSDGILHIKDWLAGGGTFNQTGSNAIFKVFHDWKPGTGSVFNSTAGTVHFTGAGGGGPNFAAGTRQFTHIILDADPVFDNEPLSNIPVSGNFTNNLAALNMAINGTITFNGTGNQTITSASTGTNATFGNLVINKPGGTVTLASNVYVTGNTTVTSGIIDASTFIFNRRAAGGTFTLSAGTTLKLGANTGGQTGSNFPLNFTTITLNASSTVEYNGSNAITQTIYATPTYGHLHLTNGTGSGSSAKITTANITVNGNLSINSGAVLTPGAAYTVGGTGTLTGSGTAVVNRTAATADLLSQYTISNKTLSSLTVDYSATLSQTVNALNYYNLTVSGARTTSSVTYANSGTIGVAGVFNPAATYTTGGRIMTGSTIDFNGITAQAVPAITYNNLTVSGPGTTKSAAGAVVVNGTLTTNSNVTFDMVTYDLSGSLTATSGTGTVKTQSSSATPLPSGKTWSGTVEYNGAAGGQTVVTGTYAGLTNSNTSGTNTVAGAITVNSSLIMNTSSVLDMVTYDMGGTLSSITGAGTLKTQSISATPLPSGKTWSGTIEYNKTTGAQTIVAGTYASLTNSNTSGTNTAAGALSVSGTLTMNASSVLNMSTYALSGSLSAISGTGTLRTQNTSGAPLPSTKTWPGTVEYNNAAGAQTIVGGTYTNLINSNTSGTNTAAAVPTVNGALTLNSSSVLDMTTYALIGSLTSISGTGTLRTQSSSALPIPAGKTWPGTVEFNRAAGGQTIVSGNYTNLVNSNTSGTNTAAAALSVSGTLTLNAASMLDLATYALSGSITTSGAGGIKTQNTSATPLPAGRTWAGSIEYNNATGGQTIVSGNYSNLTNSNTSGTNTAAAALSVSGTLTLNSSSMLNLATYALSGSITISGAGGLKTQNTSATPLPSGRTWAGSVEYNNATGGQTIVAGTYSNLTNSNTSGTNTAAAALSVSGTLTLNPSSMLDLGTYALTGSVSAISGTGALKTQNTSATPIPTGSTWTGPIFYNSSSLQTIVRGNYSDLNATGGNRIFDTLSAIGISGTFTPGAGTYTITGSTLDFNSTGAQTLPAFSYYNLTVSGGNTKSVGGNLSVKNLLALGSNTTLALNNNIITLKSDSANTASIATVPATAAITYGTGAFTVERYIIGRRKYRMITSSVNTSPNATLTVGEESKSIWGNWQNSGSNATANLGSFITGGSVADGFDTQIATPSMYTYDAVNRVFKAFSTANGKNTKYTPLKAGVPYYLFVYGDRQQTVTTTNPHNTVLTATGTIITGDQVYDSTTAIPISTVADRYSLIGNPYASTIDWKKVTKSQVSKTVWAWDPNLNNQGGYVTVTDVLNGILISPLSGAVKISQYIQPGQAFFVKTTGSHPRVTIKEADKVNSTTNGIFLTDPVNPLLAINMLYPNGPVSILADGTVVTFDPSYSNAVNEDDVKKYAGSTEVVSILNSGNLLALETKAFPANYDTLFLSMQRLTRPVYTLEIFAKDIVAGTFRAFLLDKFLNTRQELSLSDTNRITVLRTTNPLSYAVDRFSIVFENGSILPVNFTSVKAMRLADNKVRVDWGVANQVNINKYSIERSANGVHFEPIGTQSANSDVTGNYSYIDVKPMSGDNFYRIRSHGHDGFTNYSAIVKVKIEGGTQKLSVYPNPVRGSEFNILMENIVAGTYNIRIINLAGNVIASKEIKHAGGNQSHTITIQGLAAGDYFVELVQPVNTRLIYKVIKL